MKRRAQTVPVVSHRRTTSGLAIVGALFAFVACGDDDALPDAASPPDGPVAQPDAPPPADARPPGPDAPPPPPGSSCLVPILLTAGDPPFASTTTAGSLLGTASCSAGSTMSPDRWFQIDAGATPVDLIVTVTVDEAAMPPFDAVVFAQTTCGNVATEIACADAGLGERMEVLGASGVITLTVDGTNEFAGMPAGDFTIQVLTRPIVGMGEICDPTGVASRCGPDLRCDGVTNTCVPTDPLLSCADAPDLTADLADGSALAAGTLHPFDADFQEGACAFDLDGARPEHVYRFTTLGSAAFVASTDDPATTFDTVLYLQAACDDPADLACADDVDASTMNYRSRLDVPALPAGTWYLFVDTSSDWLYGPATSTPRDYQLTVTLTP